MHANPNIILIIAPAINSPFDILWYFFFGWIFASIAFILASSIFNFVSRFTCLILSLFSNNIFCFWLHQRADKEYAKSYFPEELIEELGRHEFLRYKIGRNVIYKHYKLYLSNTEKEYYSKIFGKPT